MTLPPTIPAIVLSDCNLLPHGLLPLYIFEPRYRLMLQHALGADRLVCIATRLPDSPGSDPPQPTPDEGIYPHATAGLVRACVRGADGSSNLILQGVKRIRFLGWPQRDPFRIAAVEPVRSRMDDVGCCRESARVLVDLALGSAGSAGACVTDHLRKHLLSVDDPETVADLVTFNFLTDAHDRQRTLGMTRVEDRLAFATEALRLQLGSSADPQGQGDP